MSRPVHFVPAEDTYDLERDSYRTRCGHVVYLGRGDQYSPFEGDVTCKSCVKGMAADLKKAGQ